MSPSSRTSSPSSSTTASPSRGTAITTPTPTNPLYIPPAPRAHASHTASTKATPPAISTRLYVGNLHPAVSEYDLVHLFTRFGKIAKLDLLFHKAGPFKGKPRGYGFVEYIKQEDALLAKVDIEGKELKGRKIAVSFAKKSEYPEQSNTGPLRRNRARDDDLKPTTLSLVKNSQQPQGTNAKIAAMEARLQAMKASKRKASEEGPGQPQPSKLRTALGGPTGTTTLQTAPLPAGLPRKPPSLG